MLGSEVTTIYDPPSWNPRPRKTEVGRNHRAKQHMVTATHRPSRQVVSPESSRYWEERTEAA